MDNIEEKNEEIQNRREFFKESAKKALPIFAIALLGSSLLSCSKDKDSASSSGSSSGCGNSCSGSCKSSCSGGCDGGCAGDCDDNCTADCWNGCSHYMR